MRERETRVNKERDGGTDGRRSGRGEEENEDKQIRKMGAERRECCDRYRRKRKENKERGQNE